VNDTERLSKFINRLKAGDRSPELKGDIQEYLLHLPPNELYLAEQKLLAAGLQIPDMVHRFAEDMGLVRDEMKRMKASLPSDHLMYRMISDHEMILDVLDELERINETIRKLNDPDGEREAIVRLQEIARGILDLEPHHECEEDAVYPEMERQGELGPPAAMRIEHDEVRRLVQELAGLSAIAHDIAFGSLKKRLDPIAKFVIFIKRDHVFKEIYILYPGALRAIKDPDEWAKLKVECRRVGYCA